MLRTEQGKHTFVNQTLSHAFHLRPRQTAICALNGMQSEGTFIANYCKLLVKSQGEKATDPNPEGSLGTQIRLDSFRKR
ncbi:hypothetical protein PGT21_010523 [Puccinia graminis f. sp. tritici]|uniref:Uncharacterized protein n=1 Tax=Puccinia graminis f. sp. tritici TaxID=56615 RepID=A0A5B0PRA1_PUCGR|nr:hypothetical protein PGT21_010523 [Puccinia graminis f. sp. tritici]